ncbi:uncharacterized protein LOC133192780 [Saccostrea echinata]|uniref:uncharacterized protein LOC133192780 n=1 Tax=Saccostrea echinata TaxID=191078 RepID=UPI002A817FF6|nr:uncharacterized protein LOC133192780 [Saccostrea echinata]
MYSDHGVSLSKEIENEALCLQHKDQKPSMFCRDCEILTCKICWKEKHCGHEQADLKKIADELRIQLVQRVNFARKTTLPNLRKISDEIRINREEYMKHGAYLRLEITDRTKHLKSQLDLTCEAILNDLSEREDADTRSLETSATAVRAELECTAALLTASDLEIKSEQDEVFIIFAQKAISKLTSTQCSKSFKPICPPTFVSSDSINRSAIEKLYGYLQQENSTIYQEKEEHFQNAQHTSSHVKVVIGHVTHLTLANNDAAYCIRTLPNGHAWVGTGAQSVRLVDAKGEVLDEVFLDFYPYNLAILNDTLLLSNGQLIKAINNGEISDFFNAAPFYSQGICRTSESEILICLAKRDEGKILRLNSCGKTLQKIQFDASGKPLYRSPTKVSESSRNGDICVSDSAENSVIVVDKSGCLRFIYRGLEGDTFSPFYVTYDSFGNILIGDNSHFRIHLVDKDGFFLQYILTVEDGLYSPWGLDVDEKKNLWVGTLSSKIWIVEYIGS